MKSQIQIFGFRSRKTPTVFCQWQLWFEKQVQWKWLHKHGRVSIRGKGFSTDSRHSKKLCPYNSRHFSVLIQSGIHKSLLSSWKKQLASQSIFTYRYIDDILSLNGQVFENNLSQIYPAEREVKYTTVSNTSASYLDLVPSIGSDGQLHTSRSDNRDDFNFHITNLPFLGSIIPSLPVYGVLSHIPYGMQRLAPLMHDLFWGRCDLYISFSNRDISGNVWNRLLGSSMVDMGISSNNMKSPCPKCYMTFWDMATYSDTFHW